MHFKKYDIAIILAAIFWGSISIFTRPMQTAGFSSVQIVAIRSVITTLVMLVFILIKNPSQLKIRIKDLWMFLGTGLASFLFFNICYMSSIGENSVSVACMLMYTSPIWVTLFSALLFREKITPIRATALIICVVSSGVMCLSSTLTLSGIGLIYGLFSGLGYALYSIFGKYATAKYSTTTVIFYTFAFAALGALPLSNPKDAVGLITSPQNLILSVGIAILCTVVPYILYTFGLSGTQAGKAAVLSIVEPVVATLVGFALFKENLGVLGFLGVVGVIFGIILLEKKTKKEVL